MSILNNLVTFFEPDHAMRHTLCSLACLATAVAAAAVLAVLAAVVVVVVVVVAVVLVAEQLLEGAREAEDGGDT